MPGLAPSPTPHPAAARYARRRRRFGELDARFEAASRRFSGARLAAFVAGAGALATILASGASTQRWAWPLAAVAFALFAALVAAHDRLLGRRRRVEALVAINAEAGARLTRTWDGWPAPVSEPPTGDEAALARDLGLVGRASLEHLLATAATPPGRQTLRRWLLAPASPATIALRQAAVRELAPRLGARQRLQAAGRAPRRPPADPERFLAWAEGEPWLARRPRLRRTVVVLSLASPALLAAALLGLVPIHAWLLLLLGIFLLSRWHADAIHEVFGRVASREAELAPYGPVFARLARLPAGCRSLAASLAALGAANHPAPREMRRLTGLAGLTELRRSALHGLFQVLLLWDFHLLAALEAWQRRSGREARGWFDSLGSAEALCALAGLAGDEPRWAFPQVDPALVTLEAEELGHPLLAADRRVGNPVGLGPPGRFLLVTGSNMSGKSTLLRSLGVNVVLAQAGGPVCARRLAMPPVALGTSLLVEDSLTDGVSFFLAELERLRRIVERAEAPAEGRRLLFLLDEVLRGTNPGERRIAVARVVRRLIDDGAIGAVTTHDLELATLEGIREACDPVHFREALGDPGRGPALTFDYRVRPGLAPTTNALRLLELVGLGPRPEESPS